MNFRGQLRRRLVSGEGFLHAFQFGIPNSLSINKVKYAAVQAAYFLSPRPCKQKTIFIQLVISDQITKMKEFVRITHSKVSDEFEIESQL